MPPMSKFVSTASVGRHDSHLSPGLVTVIRRLPCSLRTARYPAWLPRSDSLDLHFWIGIDAKRIAASCQTGQAFLHRTPYRSHHGHSRIA